jgi:tRNA modification GTPase
MTNHHDTIVALSTAQGVGAIGLVRLSGAEAIQIADLIFKGKKLSNVPTHTAHFGAILATDGAVIDEVVITVYRNPKSYTGQDLVELSCHGSPYIQQCIIERCMEAGARLAAPGEFTMRAYLNGKLDLSQAEAVGDLISAQNAASHRIALHQLRGGFRTELSTLREELIHFASLLELELDFSEEDVEFAPRAELRALVERSLAHVRKLSETFRLGNAIRNGISTVIAGRPNAGKSTLLNALLNEERAIVSEIAGTTRDVIEEVLHIQGVAFRLTDTAGIRAAQDQIEAIGVERTLQKLAQASIVLYVWEIGSTPISDLQSDLAAYLPEQWQKPGTESDRPNQDALLIICNKLDQHPDFDTSIVCAALHLAPEQVIAVSARNMEHLQDLKNRIYQLGIGGDFSLENTVVSNARHQEALLRTAEALQATMDGLASGLTNDFLALHMRDALFHIGSITGDISVEDLLGNIFGKFCIGK